MLLMQQPTYLPSEIDMEILDEKPPSQVYNSEGNNNPFIPDIPASRNLYCPETERGFWDWLYCFSHWHGSLFTGRLYFLVSH